MASPNNAAKPNCRGSNSCVKFFDRNGDTATTRSTPRANRVRVSAIACAISTANLSARSAANGKCSNRSLEPYWQSLMTSFTNFFLSCSTNDSSTSASAFVSCPTCNRCDEPSGVSSFESSISFVIAASCSRSTSSNDRCDSSAVSRSDNPEAATSGAGRIAQRWNWTSSAGAAVVRVSKLSQMHSTKSREVIGAFQEVE